MKFGRIISIAVITAAFLPLITFGQDETGPGMLSIEGTPIQKDEPKVTAVYGMSADDYLPATTVARKHLRPKVQTNRSRPAFNLPEAFYYIGGPVFIFLFLRVLVIFLNGFEEKRREELRTVAREVWDVE
jgi:hypothetical protein